MKEYLNKNSERKLQELGNKRFYKVLVLTVAWITFVVVSFVMFVISDGRSFAEMRNYILLAPCILPFFPFSAHKTLFSKTFYATVAYTVNATQYGQIKRAYVSQKYGVESVSVLEVTYTRDDGQKFTVVYKKDKYLINDLHFDEGDRVFFARGLKYPMEFPLPEGKAFKCPVCGRSVQADSQVCSRCKTNYHKLIY